MPVEAQPVEAAPVEAAPEPSYVPTSEYEAAPPAIEPEPSYHATSEPSYQATPEPAFSGTETIPTYEAEPAEVGSLMDGAGVAEATTAADEATQTSGFAVDEPAPETWAATPVDEPVAATPRRRFGQDAELPVEVHGDEERRLHNDARRFARLLISEIKLYNEQKVAEGRAEHDLYDRLREYIDRSREMYDKRVKAEVATRYDYFHGELVNTLAEGDVSKLGSNYPGATVNA